MPKCNNEHYIAIPKIAENSCKGCYWYPSKGNLYRYSEKFFKLKGTVDAYLLKGCMAMHKNHGGSLCSDLNIIFQPVSNKNEK